MNPIEIFKMIKNPKEFVMNYMKANNNPILNNLIKQAESGNKEEIEKFANNMLQEKGINLNDIMKQVK